MSVKKCEACKWLYGLPCDDRMALLCHEPATNIFCKAERKNQTGPCGPEGKLWETRDEKAST